MKKTGVRTKKRSKVYSELGVVTGRVATKCRWGGGGDIPGRKHVVALGNRATEAITGGKLAKQLMIG